MLSIALLVCLIAFSSLPPAQATELSAIKKRGYLIVGVKDNLRPLGFRDQDQLQGFEIEIARQLASDLLGDETAVEFRPLLNQDRLQALLKGEVDILVARMTVTASRQRLVDFSRPYFIDGTAFLTRDGIENLADLTGQPVAVLSGSDTIASVRSLLPQIRLRGVASYADARLLLEAGEVVAVAADSAVLTGWSQEDPQYRLIPTLISSEALAVAAPRGRQYQELRQQINAVVERWLTNGWLRRQIRTWGLPAEGFPSLSSSAASSPTEPSR
ncbi:MAG: transporter substrate-binding domain-containing protein [Elainella sp.]